jgi:uncharacterized membrane protein
MQNQKSAIGLDGNVTALIGYLIGIVALVLIFIEKDNRFVRFHAIQSVLWGVGCTIAFIAIMIVGMILGLIVFRDLINPCEYSLAIGDPSLPWGIDRPVWGDHLRCDQIICW